MRPKKHRRTREEFVFPCYYCGQVATGIDHVTPRSIKERLSEDIENPVHARTMTVPCCHECNSALGARIYDDGTLNDRKHAAKAHIRKTYKKFLKIPTWTESEIRELGYELENYVRHGIIIKRLVEMRLRW